MTLGPPDEGGNAQTTVIIPISIFKFPCVNSNQLNI